MYTEDQLIDINNEELKERVEHRDALLAIQTIMTSEAGRHFIKYLFKNLDVGELPEFGLSGELLMDRLGFLRAGNSVFKLIAEANSEITGQIIGLIEKEKYAQIEYDQVRERARS
jgi:hypothetical protein